MTSSLKGLKRSWGSSRTSWRTSRIDCLIQQQQHSRDDSYLLLTDQLPSCSPWQLWNGIEALFRKLSWGTVTVVTALILWNNWWSEHAASLDKNVVLMWWNRSICKLVTHRLCLLYLRGFTFWHHLVQYVTIVVLMTTLLPWNTFLCYPEQCRDWEVEIDLVTWLTTYKDFTMGLHLGSGPDMQCINQELEELEVPAVDGHWCLHLDAQASSLRAACKIVLIHPHICQGYQRQGVKRSLQESRACHMSTTYQELPEIEWYLVDNFFSLKWFHRISKLFSRTEYLTTLSGR